MVTLKWFIYSEEWARVGQDRVSLSIWFRKFSTFRYGGKRYWRIYNRG